MPDQTFIFYIIMATAGAIIVYVLLAIILLFLALGEVLLAQIGSLWVRRRSKI